MSALRIAISSSNGEMGGGEVMQLDTPTHLCSTKIDMSELAQAPPGERHEQTRSRDLGVDLTAEKIGRRAVVRRPGVDSRKRGGAFDVNEDLASSSESER